MIAMSMLKIIRRRIQYKQNFLMCCWIKSKCSSLKSCSFSSVEIASACKETKYGHFNSEPELHVPCIRMVSYYYQLSQPNCSQFRKADYQYLVNNAFANHRQLLLINKSVEEYYIFVFKSLRKNYIVWCRFHMH